MNQNNVQEVMDSWMNSEGHRANILSSEYTKLGVRHYVDADGDIYWVQEFIG